jgi:two-component sensor histidine kinase
MEPDSKTSQPVVESAPSGDSEEVSRRALRQRIRQQELLADLGVSALRRDTAFEALLETAVQLAAEGLDADFCKVLEFEPQQNRFVLRAGVGWDPALIGVATVGADLESPAGFSLKTGKPVISNHLENEERFRTPELLRAHGVRRAINVILQGDNTAYGVLEVDSRSEGEFGEHDISFLQGAANILGMAIERQRYEASLKQALDLQQVLLEEINHRVKNSLQLVVSMLGLQANTTKDGALSESLQEAMMRVTAVARVHERLHRGVDINQVDLSSYMADICLDLKDITYNCDLQYSANQSITVPADYAVRVALLASELITNAAKHAYGADEQGSITVELSMSETMLSLRVRDRGLGPVENASPTRNSGLGMQIVRALTSQMGGQLTVSNANPGTDAHLVMPLRHTSFNRVGAT